MVEALLKLLIGIVGLLAFNIIFTNTLYKQKPNVKNVSILSSLTVLILGFIFTLWKVVDALSNFKIVGAIDNWYGKFSTNVPFGFLLIWLVVPLVIGFIIYFILGVNKKRSIHKDYKKWQKEEAEKNQPEHVDGSKNSEAEERVQNEVQKEDRKEQPLPLESKSDEAEILDVRPNVDKIDYVSFAGLKRVYNDAKNQLQISKYKKDAYVAVYVNKKGLNELKRIFSQNSIDTSDLSTEASVVYFTDSKVQIMSLMNQIKKAKEKQKNEAFQS